MYLTLKVVVQEMFHLEASALKTVAQDAEADAAKMKDTDTEAVSARK